MRFRRGTATLAALLLAAGAGAQVVELTPFAGMRAGGTLEDPSSAASYELEATPSIGLVVGFPLQGDRVLELAVSHQESDVTTAGLDPLTVGFDVDLLHLGGTWSWGESRVRGFVSGYAGAALLDPDLPGYGVRGYASLAFGGGARVALGRRVGLRLEGLGVGIFELGSAAGFCGGSGCVLALAGGGTIQLEARVGLTVRFGPQR